MSKPYYITTAIDYVNGKPHLGHTYEKVLADAIARTARLMGEAVYFLTGVDEHGQKIQQKAQSAEMEPQAFCDLMCTHFVDLVKALNISNDDFIRTTQARHKRVVLNALQKLFDDGLIYKAEYSGFYSVKEERFLQEKDRVDGEWPAIFGEVKEIVESNYFFKMSNYQDWLIEHLNKEADFIFPAFRQKQVVEFLKEPLNDLCISRPVERLSWGIPLPFDNNFVTYVWFDALLNYVSAVDSVGAWPADVHVIGKDILVPAHAVYWPIMLKALNLPLPKKILAHGWWLTSGQKLSKSLGNCFEPLDWVNKYGADAVRFFLLREMVTGQDSEFSEEAFTARYNNELANEWGNLISRTFNMIHRYCGGVVPNINSKIFRQIDLDIQNLWDITKNEVIASFENHMFSHGLEKLFKFIRELNKYIEINAPWKLAKSTDNNDLEILKNTMAFLTEGIRLANILLSPIIPDCSQKITNSFESNSSALTFNPSTLSNSKILNDKLLLFPKK